MLIAARTCGPCVGSFRSPAMPGVNITGLPISAALPIPSGMAAIGGSVLTGISLPFLPRYMKT